MITADDICAEAARWEGVPYAHMKRTRRHVDCGGLLLVVGWACGVWPRTFDITGYPREPDGTLRAKLLEAGMIPAGQFDRAHPATADSLLPGMAVLIGDHPQVPSHLGIVLGRDIIHAYIVRGRVVRHGLRGKFLTRIHAAYQFPGVVYG